MWTEIRVFSRARRNRSDVLRFLRRPALAAGMAGYEVGLLLSSRVETRLKFLAQLRSAALIGCPF
jgi:hypothetical protein